VDSTFWTRLKDLKLDQLHLSEEPLPLQGAHLLASKFIYLLGMCARGRSASRTTLFVRRVCFRLEEP